MATATEFISNREAVETSEAEPEMEYPVTLAYTSEPVMRLVGTVRIVGRGRQDFALSDQEWQYLGLPDETTEEAEEMADAASTK